MLGERVPPPRSDEVWLVPAARLVRDIVMKDAIPDVEAQYREVLRVYLAEGDEATLLRAYELGRKALEAGLGALTLVNAHLEALRSLNVIAQDESLRRVVQANQFLVECLSPFEMMHRAHIEANTALRRLNTALEDEARRIAHVLHDEAAQLLATVYLDLAEAELKLPNAGAPYVPRIRAHLEQMRQHLRGIAHELRPPILDDLGLMPALRFLAERIASRGGITLAVRGDPGRQLSHAAEMAIYRVAQEALSNMIRHARATQAEIDVRRDAGAVHCTIRDNGVGFDVASVRAKHGNKGLGLIGMQERLAPLRGLLQVRSAPGQGTELFVSIPYP